MSSSPDDGTDAVGPVPDAATPDDETPDDGTPDEIAPDDETRADETVADETVADETVADETVAVTAPPRQRVTRVSGSRRARLEPVAGTDTSPDIPVRREPRADRAGTRGENDDRLRADVPPHW